MILVTGASGNIGSELVKKLSSAGLKFRAASHGKKLGPAPGCEVVDVDYANAESVRAALKGIDAVFLLVPFAPNQAELDATVAEEAKRAGVKLIVKSSVIAADKEGYTIARWHRAGERAIEKTGIAHCFLRPNTFMQNMNNFFAATIKSQGAFYIPAKDSKTSFIDVRDVASVAAKVLTEKGHEGKAYELTGPESLTFGQLAEQLGAVIGKKVGYVDLPPAEYKKSMLGYGVPEWMVDGMIDLDRYAIEGGCAEVTGTVEKITGRKPIAFAQYARDYAATFK
jgi:uncharacterized protein YbjT (DUF2867 family)